MKFSRSTWSAMAVVLSTATTAVRADAGIPDTLENYNITECALGIRDSISSPTCNATEPCMTFVTSTVPRCQSLHNDPGCWCGNHDPLHYCAQCMSSPTDNTTTADQMEQAVSNHRGYHIYCATYAKILNGTEPNPANAGQSSGGSKTNVGAIAGGVVGGVAVVALIAIGVWFFMKKRAQRRMSPSREFMSQQNTGNGPSVSGRGSVFSSSNGGKSQFGGSSNPGSPAPMMGLAYNSPTPASFNPYAPSGSPGLSNTGHPMSPNGTGSQYGGNTAGSRNSQALGYDTSMLSHLSPPAQQGSFPPVAEQMDYSTAPAQTHYSGNR